MSGRDTPSSQVTEDGGDDSQNRQPRNDVDDGGIDNVDHQVLNTYLLINMLVTDLVPDTRVF